MKLALAALIIATSAVAGGKSGASTGMGSGLELRIQEPRQEARHVSRNLPSLRRPNGMDDGSDIRQSVREGSSVLRTPFLAAGQPLNTFLLELPLPPRALSPNSRTYRKNRSVILKQYRDGVKLLVSSEMRKQKWSAPAKARISIRYCVKGCVKAGLYSPRDWDNAVAAFKTAQDGIVLAGALVGDSRDFLVGGEVEFNQKRGPFIEVRIESLSGPAVVSSGDEPRI